MKKTILGYGLLLMAGSVSAQTGQYKLNMSISVNNNINGYSCDGGNSMKITGYFSDGSTRVIANESLDGGSCLPKYFTETATYNNNLHLDSVHIQSGTIQWQGTLNGNVTTYSGYSNIIPPSTSICFSANYTTYTVERLTFVFPAGFKYVSDNNYIIPGYYSQVQFDVYPVGITIANPGINNFLPAADKINLTATTGFTSSHYRWQYSLNGTSWNDFPASLQGNSSVNFSGIDLYGSSFGSIFPSNTQIRIDYGCGAGYSNIITLTNTLSSPHIVSVTPVSNKCYGESNGSLKIQFDRALLPDEDLTILANNITTGVQPPSQLNVTLAADNSYTWPALGAGTYNISLFGSYPASVTPTYVTYTGSPSHTASATIVSPAPMTYAAALTNDVHCYGGSDGAIGINASGGVGNYQAGYQSPGQSTYTWLPFSTASQMALNNLTPGSYSIRTMDGNGCVQRDGANNEVISTVSVGQPATPLQLDYSQLTNPLAYGYSDGQVTAVLIGGTPNTDGSYSTAWTDGNGASLSGAVNTPLGGGSYQTQLTNRGDGSYILQAADANYALAAAGQQNGCILKDTFTLVQPPPLVVNIEQTRQVTCHGYATAQLVAHGQGGIIIPGTRYTYQWYAIPAGSGSPAALGQNDSTLSQLPAGDYQVVITDKNGITKTSLPFTIGQPISLTVSITTTPLSCNGDSTGIALASGSGGTLPFRYNWSTGDTTAIISGLTEGGYFVFVVDSNGCQAQQVASVTAPGGLLIDTVVIAPTCHQGSDGSIALQVSGGAGGYTYSWNTGATATGAAAAINSLSAGDYSVRISDANGCTAIRSFVLPDPPLLPVNAGRTTTLCNGQSYTADATIPDPAALYQWSSDNGFTANTALITITDTGTYRVMVTDSHGCVGRDSFGISRTDRDIAADFLVSTQVFQGQRVDMVNISKPDPDSIAWIIPDTSVINVISKDQVTASLLFTDTGSYTIGLTAYAGPCWKITSQKVIVLQAQSFDDPGTVGDPLVQSFGVTPNPSNGEFAVHIVLSDIATIRLRLISVLTDVTLDDRQASGSTRYDLSYHMSNIAKGEYFILLETPKGNSVYKIMIL